MLMKKGKLRLFQGNGNIEKPGKLEKVVEE